MIGLMGFSLASCNEATSSITTTTEYIYEDMVFNDLKVSKVFDKITDFPDIPEDYVFYDYEAVARELDQLLFAFANVPDQVLPDYIINDQTTWNPIGFWIDQAREVPTYDPLSTGYMRRSFGFPTYVADTRVTSTGTEAITTIASVLSASYVGIDKSAAVFADDTYDFVEMLFANYDTGTKLVTNGGIQGQSFWYDIFPQILFARLYDLYEDTEYMREMVINGADEWLEALPNMQEEGLPYYDFVGYNVALESPTTSGDHVEPPNGGLAFLFYSAYEITKDEKYLDGAKEVLDYLQNYWGNPNYEALTDYAPYVAAVLNYRYGTTYDIGKFLDFLFEEDSTYRFGWTVMSGGFGDYAVDGLVGQDSDYTFAMNSFHLASVLAPMVKYDTRYSDAIGKYFLNLTNNAKVFFPQSVSLDHQTMADYLYFDKYGVICYEGFRHNYGGITGLQMGDGTTMFGIPSDLSIYSSAYIGLLGAIVSKTDVSGILRLDLNVTDSYGLNEYPYYLFYNPYDEAMTITYRGNAENYDLFEATTKTLFAKNVSNEIRITVPPHASIVTVELPANSKITKNKENVEVNGNTIAKYQAAVDIIGLEPMQQLTEDTDIILDYETIKNDEVINMKIYFNEILAYDGIPIDIFNYDKQDLPDTDYTLKVVITTANGLTDYQTKRVVCL